MKRCSRCILPSNYPNIKFDNRGICNICESFEKRWKNYDWDKKKIELGNILEKAKSKKARYDCIIPVSGGKDSAYALYICTQIYKMKVLALNFNNGFVSSMAFENLSRMAKLFDADYISWGPKWSTLKLAYRTFFLKTGDFCPPCSRAITSFSYRVAQKEGVPLIILGFNPRTDINPSEIELIDQRHLKHVIGNEMTNRELSDFTMFEAKRFFTKRIDLPSFIPYREEEIKNVLNDALGADSAFSGSMHFDCTMSTVADWLRRRKWGFGKKTQKYSALVRDGQMTREEALQSAEGPDAEIEPENLAVFMKMLDISLEDIERATHLSPLSFKHYNPRMVRFVGKIFGVIDKDYK